MTRLFIEPSATKMNILKASAVKAVEALPRAHFLNPALGGSLEKIIASHVPTLASLKPDGISKSRPKELNSRIAPVMTVYFEFNGDVETLKIRPQGTIAIDKEFDFTRTGIDCSFVDNDVTDAAIDHIVDQIDKNLELLRQEWKNWPAAIATEVHRVADILVEQVRSQKERDDKSKYPTKNV